MNIQGRNEQTTSSPRKISTRIADNWLVLTHVDDCTWRLQVFGDTPLEAEITAGDEATAKESAVQATMERLNLTPLEPTEPCPHWNAVVTSRWETRP